MERVSVTEEKVTYTPESVKDIFNMTAKEVIDTMLNAPDDDYIFRYIPKETREKIRAPNFRDTSEYEKLIENMSVLEKVNQKTKENVLTKMLPAFADRLSKYLSNFDIQISADQVLESISGIHIIPLDAYSFPASILKNKFTEDKAVIGFYIPTIDALFINNRRVSDRMNMLSKESSELVEVELMNSTLCHELLHAMAYQNLWKRLNEDDNQKVEESFYPRRSGIANMSLEGESRLNLLNEAITQTITVIIAKPVFDKPYAKPLLDILDRQREAGYNQEREVLNLIIQKVPIQKFILAYFFKNAILDLARTVKKEFNLTLDEISSSMEKEKKSDVNTTYPETKKLLVL